MGEPQVYIKNRMHTAVSITLKSGVKWLRSAQIYGPIAAEEITKEVRDAETKGLIVVIEGIGAPVVEAVQPKNAK